MKRSSTVGLPVLPHSEPIGVTLHAAYTSRMYLTPKVRSFIDHLAEFFAPEQQAA